MIKNYIIIFFRNFSKYRNNTIINVFGLTISLTIFILILSWVNDEMSYDKFHKNYDEIYRVTAEAQLMGKELKFAISPGPLGLNLKSNYPDVKDFTKIHVEENNALLIIKDKKYSEKGVFFVDTSFFKVFSFKAIKGVTNNSLSEPNSVVITKSIAEKYFGNINPLGQVIQFRNNPFEVKAVVDDPPKYSHFSFSILFTQNSNVYYAGNDYQKNNWGNFSFYTYLLLGRRTNLKNMEKNIFSVLSENNKRMNLNNIELQHIGDIHLHSDLQFEIGTNGNILYIYIFAFIAIGILIISGINYTNIAIASGISRVKEIGIRKVVGADKNLIALQFIFESLFYCIIAMILAMILSSIIPYYLNYIVGIDLSVEFLNQLYILFALTLVTFLLAITAGIYPAFILSSFNISKDLKSSAVFNNRSSIRKIMIIVQFTISIVLITVIVIFSKQLNFIKTKELGFNKENILVIPIKEKTALKNIDDINLYFQDNPNILNCALSSSYPGNIFPVQGYEIKELQKKVQIRTMQIDKNFISMYNIKIKTGREFLSKDDNHGIILNEAAVKFIGLDKPLNKIIRSTSWNKDLEILGIVADFHFASFKETVEPIALFIIPSQFQYLSIRINGANIPKTIQYVESKFNKLFNGLEFKFFFLDESLDKTYKYEENLSKLFLIFTIIAIFLAISGVFGLASFSMQKRIKEIGIRKILGASTKSILFVLSKEYLVLIMVSGIIAAPISYVILNTMLKNYAYRIDIPVEPFLYSAMAILTIVLFTVGLVSKKVVQMNPIDSLRNE